MNYEDMSDHEINMAVTCIENNCQGWSVLGDNSGFYHCGVDGNGYYEQAALDYCNNPSDAWPIIVENAISIQPVHDVAAGGYYKLSEIKYWTAWATNRQSVDSFTEDKNPLRAAMICFLKMKDAENGS